ncbi:MAG: acyl-CoA thioesterase [Chloroflexi bacterium]|nr:acyl-CoA thioesterase [Chloroflexota bacterium]
MGKVIETTFRVRYAETDASGVVYHAHYIVWFELGRGEWFWQQDRDYHRDVEARGLNWPVVELSSRYLAPARYGDLVTVRTWFKESKSREFTLAYEVVNAATRQKLCEGWTKHLNVDAQWHVVKIPDELRELMSG